MEKIQDRSIDQRPDQKNLFLSQPKEISDLKLIFKRFQMESLESLLLMRNSENKKIEGLQLKKQIFEIEKLVEDSFHEQEIDSEKKSAFYHNYQNTIQLLKAELKFELLRGQENTLQNRELLNICRYIEKHRSELLLDSQTLEPGFCKWLTKEVTGLSRTIKVEACRILIPLQEENPYFYIDYEKETVVH